MIRFKKDDLAYTMAYRAFTTEAAKGGNNPQKQLARAQNQYNILCGRHAKETKFLVGVDKAFEKFHTELMGYPPSRTDLSDAVATGPSNATGLLPPSIDWRTSPVYEENVLDSPQHSRRNAFGLSDEGNQNVLEGIFWESQYRDTEAPPTR